MSVWRLHHRQFLLVAAATVAFVAFFSWFAIERHDGLMTHTADLGQIDLAIWNTLHGRFVQEVKGEVMSTRLTDHIEPVFWPVSVVFGLWDDARALLSLQALVIGLAGLAVWGAVAAWWPGRASRLRLLAATWAALAYLLAPQVQAATVADFHASPLAVLPLALLLLLGRRQRTVPALVAAAAAIAVKEEISLVVAAAALVIAFTSGWKPGYGVAAVAVAWFVLATLVIIPSYSIEAYGEATMPYLARYDGTESSDSGSALSSLAGIAARALSADRLAYMLGLLAAFGFMPLLAPEVAVIAVPLVAANVLSHYDAQFSGEFHYSAPFMSVLAVAAGVGASRLLRWASRIHRRLPTVALLVLAAIPVGYQVAEGFTPFGAEYYLHRPTSARSQSLSRFADQIPTNASLSITPALHPHFSHREHIYTFPDLAGAQYVLLDVAGTTDMAPADMRARFDALLESGYGVADAEDGMVLLRQGEANAELPPGFYAFSLAKAAPTNPTNVQFGTSLRLTGYDWLDDAKWGYTSLRLHWEAVGPLAASLTPYALLVDGRGQIVTDSRSAPLLELFWVPLSAWEPGQSRLTTTVAASLGDAWGAYVGVVVDGDFDQVAARLVPDSDGTALAIRETNLARLPPVQRAREGLRPTLVPLVSAAPAQTETPGTCAGWLQYRGAEALTAVSAGDNLPVTSFWSRADAPTAELALSIRLVNARGETVAQLDGPVQHGLYPPAYWAIGEVVPDDKTLTLPAALPPGDHTLVAIPYDRLTSEPLDCDVEPFVLGRVHVGALEGPR